MPKPEVVKHAFQVTCTAVLVHSNLQTTPASAREILTDCAVNTSSRKPSYENNWHQRNASREVKKCVESPTELLADPGEGASVHASRSQQARSQHV